jgi:hypothetical protein
MKLIKQWKRWRKKRNARTITILRSEIKALKARDKVLVADIRRKADLVSYLCTKMSKASQALDGRL